MKARKYVFDVRLQLVAPVISQAVDFSTYGFDTTTLKDRKDNPRNALPGTLIKGNIRHILEYLIDESIDSDSTIDWLNEQDIINWFGTASTNNQQPERGILHVSEFFITDTPKNTSTHDGDSLHRIRINPLTGTTRTGALLSIHSDYLPGTIVQYHGHFSAVLVHENQAMKIVQAIDKALWLTPAVGSFKGIGFGEITEVEVKHGIADPVPDTDLIQAMQTVDSGGMGLRLKPAHPFCFAKPAKGNNNVSLSNTDDAESEWANDRSGLDNEFSSQPFIPGAAILGSLLTMTRQIARQANTEPQQLFPKLYQYKDLLRFTHAYPCHCDSEMPGRPHPIPLSIVKAGSGFYDICHHSTPGLIDGEAPEFSIDWKGGPSIAYSSELNLCAEAPTVLSIHHKTSRTTGASEHNKLFSIESVVPDNHEFLCNLYYPLRIFDDNSSDKSALDAELLELFSLDLHWLGKTTATSSVAVSQLYKTTGAQTKFDQIEDGDTVTITLLSDTRLFLPTSLCAINSGAELHALYAKKFKELSDDSLALSHFYASQHLEGGSYIQRRYFSPNNRNYRPQILTNAGSVFVFSLINANKAANYLASWLQSGLPVADKSESNWQNDPWLPQHGYGEIAVNLTSYPSPDKQWSPITDAAVEAQT